MAAAAAATTTTTIVPTVAPAPAAAPATATVPTIGPVYPQAQLVQQMTVQPQIQTYFPQPPQPQTQSQLSGKIMAQPQMYNQPPPPPPQGYQQHPQQPQQMHRQQQPPPSNQWQQQPPLGRFNQAPPANYNQAPHPSDPSMFPNMQQPPPSFMQKPPLSSVSQIDAPWAMDQNKATNDRGNINEADERRGGWDEPPPDFGRQQQQGPPHNRWQPNEQGNNKNNGSNKPNQFGNRRNWQNNPAGINNKNSNNRTNPFSSAAPNHYGSDSSVAADPGDGNYSSTGGIDGRSYSISSHGTFVNNEPGQGAADNFGSGSFDINCRGGNNNNNNKNERQEHNRQNQSGVNFGHSHDSNTDCGGYNQVSNRNSFNHQHQQQQHQRATDLDEASFDRLFDQWEKQFEDWKSANANHPDRDEYRRYEEEFEKQRRRIADRREQMRRRRQLQNPQQSQQQTNQQQPYPKAQQQHQMQQGVNCRPAYDNFEEDASRCEQHNRGNSPKDVSFDQTNNRISDAVIEDQHGLPNTFKEKEAHGSQSNKQQEQVRAQLVKPSQQSSQQKHKHQQATNSPKSSKSVISTPSPTFRKQPQQEVEKSKCKAKILGKRKTDQSDNMEATSSPAKTAKEDNILIISLDDDDDDEDVDNADYVQKQHAEKEEDSVAYSPMKNIFKKSDGIPGLDLVADGQVAAPSASVSAVARPTDALSADNNKKIPSLFDVVIVKPVTEPEKEPVAAKQTISKTLPDDVSNALKDPEFMNNLSQALAQAQGRDTERQQSNEPAKQCTNKNSNTNNNNNDRNNDGRPMSFAEWQRKKNNQESDQKNDEPIRNLSNFGPGSGNREGCGSGGGFGPDKRQQQRYGPNGSAFMHGAGPGDSQMMGPNFIDFSGPSGGSLGCNGPPSGPNFGAPNFDRQGSDNGPGPRHGSNPGPFGGGSGYNGPFERNFGPGGPNNPNF